MKPFSFSSPSSVGEALALLAEHDDARLMAGGLDLIHEMKQGIRSPSIVVHLARVQELEGITANREGMEIGARTTVRELESDPLVREHAPLLAEAAKEIATPQLRVMGTVAGNVLQRPQCWYYRDPDSFCLRKGGQHCHAVAGDNRYHAILGGGPCHIVCPSDLAPALLALGASAVVRGPGDDERIIPLSQLFVGPRVDPHNEHVLRRDEIISCFAIPSSAGRSQVFLKARERTAWDFALASVSAVVDLAPDLVVRRASLVLGGVAPNPWDAAEAAQALVGATLDDAAIQRAAEASVRDARPLRANAYKVDLTRRLVVSALQRVLGGKGPAK